MDPDPLRQENKNYHNICLREEERKRSARVNQYTNDIKHRVDEYIKNKPRELINSAKEGHTYFTLWKQNPFFCTIERLTRCRAMNDAVKNIDTYRD